jgi:hypothetical protein
LPIGARVLPKIQSLGTHCLERVLFKCELGAGCEWLKKSNRYNTVDKSNTLISPSSSSSVAVAVAVVASTFFFFRFF